MQFSSEFMQLSLRKDSQGRDVNVSRLSIASLQRRPDEESNEDFEKRQLASFALFKDQAALLETVCATDDLFPALSVPSKIAHGVAEFEQVWEGMPDPGRLAGQDLLAVAHSIGQGLDALHGLGGLHLGIHPAALSFRFGGQPLLYGIGAEMRRVAAEDEPLSALGDASFFPPELFDKSLQSKVGPWTDIYQTCATLYALSTGEAPPNFAARLKDNKTSFALIESRLNKDNALVQSGLAHAIMLGLRLSRNQRPQNVEEWLAGVEKASPVKENVPFSGTEGLLAGEAPIAEAPFVSLGGEPDVSFIDDDLDQGDPEDSVKQRSGFGRAVLTLFLVGAVFAGGYYTNAFLIGPQGSPQMADGIDDGGSDAIEGTDITNEIAEEAAEEELVEEEPFAAEWLVGNWVINEEENGCEARLIIQPGDAPDELRFINPDDDITGIDSFTQPSPNSIETSSWIYTLDGSAVNVVGVNDSEQTLTLTNCTTE